jgi:RNA polymerase sigma factor (sigma-70 family)
LAQRVFLHLASRAAALQTRTSIAGWLYRTSWHVCTRHRRDRATRDLREREAGTMRAAGAAPACNSGGEVPFAVITSELCAALSGALAALPENHRNALVLHYFAGHTVGQTAEVLGVRIGTAAAWLSRGRDMLRTHMQKRDATLASSVVEAWLGEEAARMLLCPPGEGALHTLEGKIGAPVVAAFVTAPPLILGGAMGTGAAATNGLLAWGIFGFSRFATSIVLGILTVGGAGMAAAAVLPGGLGGLFTSGDAGPRALHPSTGGSPTSITNPSGDAMSRAGGFGGLSLAGGSIPEPGGLAALGGAAALLLTRHRQRSRIK